jgi:predicted nucleic acid-binding protein
MRAYVDTSALAKWYVVEAGSDRVAAWVSQPRELVTSRLTIIELRCLLARKRRAGAFDRSYENAAYRRFLEQALASEITLLPLDDALAIEAADLIDRVQAVGLRTLDALHLVTAEASLADTLATSDQVMAAAAKDLGFNVQFF